MWDVGFYYSHFVLLGKFNISALTFIAILLLETPLRFFDHMHSSAQRYVRRRASEASGQAFPVRQVEV